MSVFNTAVLETTLMLLLCPLPGSSPPNSVCSKPFRSSLTIVYGSYTYLLRLCLLLQKDVTAGLMSGSLGQRAESGPAKAVGKHLLNWKRAGRREE